MTRRSSGGADPVDPEVARSIHTEFEWKNELRVGKNGTRVSQTLNTVPERSIDRWDYRRDHHTVHGSQLTGTPP
jgi:hypothetical protein